jgi:homoserine dehydrogenase
VVAVVSALAGETDQLLRLAAEVTGLTSCRGVPDLVSLGEERTAAMLRLACERIGLHADICRPEDVGLRTAGDALGAHPVGLEPSILVAKLRLTGVVIVPGYVGVGAGGERTLLGRGGSDLSAIYLAGELGADGVELYKDVDGVFEQDPANDEDARRFAEISWADALQIARPLIQPQAVEYAASKKLCVGVGALGSFDPTCVGPRTSPVRPREAVPALRVSLAGFGVVGQALAERLRDEPRFKVVSVLVRDPAKARAVPPPAPLTSDKTAFLAQDTDVIVDALSCETTGSLLCNAVLPKGVHIVSASKRLISTEHSSLADAAQSGRAQLLYSAAVGGSATVLETVDRARREGPVEEVVGVLNGTVNFVLQRLFDGVGFEAALREAQQRGFAEEDADADLSGEDAAAKLRLIAHRASDVDPRSVIVTTERLDEEKAESIRLSRERWVQLARFTQESGGQPRASVSLEPLREVETLPAILDEWNCAAVRLVDGRVYRCLGRGAGGAATAEAIVADLYELALAPGAELAARCASTC